MADWSNLEGLPAKLTEAIRQASILWLKETSDAIVQRLNGWWPDVGTAHPYATGKSAKAWKVEAIDTWSVRISNTEGYAGYVELGYTRKGEGTARPWQAKGSVPYLQSIVDAAMPDAMKRWEELIQQEIGRITL